VVRYSVTILANVEECRTEAEISRDGQIVAIIYEASSGWHTQIVEGHLMPTQIEFNGAVQTARKTLSHYINRRGKNPPQNMTRGAFSLRLMMKDDGTVMGTGGKTTSGPG
jgi:hypothetical protein